MRHPARFSPAIVDALDVLLPAYAHVHDPFAGTGERLGELCDRTRRTFSGTEIEECFIVDPRVKPGNSADPRTYPIPYYSIATSPVYPNGVADGFKPADLSRRFTYRKAKMEATGDPDACLDPANMGRHSYRSGRAAKYRYWEIATACAAQWRFADCVVLNVSDFIMAGRVVPLVESWRLMLMSLGWCWDEAIQVPTPRIGYGANRDVRVDTESIIRFTHKEKSLR